MADRKLKILIVDDEMEILKLLKEVFELRGWDIIVTPVGTSVPIILDKEAVDVVLLDIKLPDGSGLDILKETRKKYPKLPIIMFTALGYEDRVVNEAMRSGASGYVSKGTAIHELIDVVNNALLQ